MLVLSRKLQEKVMVGGNISICVVEIRGDRVRLGIEAPPNVAIHRSEIAEIMQQHGQTIPNLVPEVAKVNNNDS